MEETQQLTTCPGPLLLLGEVCAMSSVGGPQSPLVLPRSSGQAITHPCLWGRESCSRAGVPPGAGAVAWHALSPPWGPRLPEASASFSAVPWPCSHELVAVRLGGHSWGPGSQGTAVLRPLLRRAGPGGSLGLWGPGSPRP